MQYSYVMTETCITSWTTRHIEQIPVDSEDVGDSYEVRKRRNEDVTLKLHIRVKYLQLTHRSTVELLITESEPGVKGNTATGATKPAIVETGAQVMVPLFVNEGEVIKIDTRSGEYLSRA